MMNADLFSRLIQQPSLLKETSKAELEQLVYQYPWFGTAQFLLAAKMKQSANESATQQIQKAAIFSNQPLWFNLQLNRFETGESTTIIQQVSSAPSFPVAEKKQAGFELIPETEEEKLANDTDAALDAEASIETEVMKEEEFSPVSDAVLDAEVRIETEAIKDELTAPVTDAVLDAKAIVEAAETREEVTVAASTSAEEQPVFTFEPFHTVDYFASQGIKLREDKSGEDKLGQQVKTFTQWLRSMKKIYVEEKKELDATEEKAVVNMATESNQQTEVLTETMADVLIKQGKLSQAIDLYRKLSLLHPEKSVYFASRIEELKP